MTPLFIQKAAACSPLGASLDEIWPRILSGETSWGKTCLPGNRDYFIAETTADSTSDINTYAPLFYDAIRNLIADLDINEPVDAIYLGTAVGNLAYLENKIYSGSSVNAEEADFSHLREIFEKTAALGPNTRFICVPTGCCAGLQAIGLAKSTMRKLDMRTAIIISLDFGLTPLALEAFNKINATSTYDPVTNGSPSRPFCKGRNGFLFADGGGAILVSAEESSGSPIQISGYGCVSSAFHMTDIKTDGHSIRQSIECALTEAQIDGSMIDHVNLHASGTEQNDTAEYNALIDIIGHDLPVITAFKGNHGHALGGANLIEVALVWKIMTERRIPPTPHHLPVDAFKEVRPRSEITDFTGRRILKTASGFSGIHAAIVMEQCG